MLQFSIVSSTQKSKISNTQTGKEPIKDIIAQ
jgi:hypothetical protein